MPYQCVTHEYYVMDFVVFAVRGISMLCAVSGYVNSQIIYKILDKLININSLRGVLRFVEEGILDDIADRM